MNRVAKFYKVSFEEFLRAFADTFVDVDYNNVSNIKTLKGVYDRILLPKRSTEKSAGYDMKSTIGFELHPGETIKIPMGIKCEFDCDWVLQIYPRSSAGFKYRARLDNTVGIIDADYYGNESNEGHIFVKITNCGDKDWVVNEGDAIIQGIFLQYGITIDDEAEGIRKGGIGSTGK